MLRVLTVAIALVAAFPALANEGQLLQAVRSHPKVLDARTDGAGTLYTAVKFERVAWDQFASQMCRAVRPFQARVLRVRVVDITSVSAAQPPGQWRRLAEANCAD